MATSNVQLQEIRTQLSQMGVPSAANLKDQQMNISQVENQIAAMDKTDAISYASALEQLYSIKSTYASSNTQEVHDLLAQEIALLEILTAQ